MQPGYKPGCLQSLIKRRIDPHPQVNNTTITLSGGPASRVYPLFVRDWFVVGQFFFPNYGEVTVPNDQHVARAGRIRRAAAFWPMWAVAGDTATASDGRGPVHLCHPATHHPIWRRKGILLAAGARHPTASAEPATSRCVPCVGYTYTGLCPPCPRGPSAVCSAPRATVACRARPHGLGCT